MDTTEGLVCAYLLDGAGGGRACGWDEVRAWTPDQGVLWVHLDYAAPQAVRWLAEESGLDRMTANVLRTREVRPRVLRVGEGMAVLLRGVNLNPGANPEDMVGIRVWIEERRMVTLRHRRLSAVRDMIERIEASHGPTNPGDFLAMMAGCLIDRIGPVLADLEDEIDALEDTVLTAHDRAQRSELKHFRRTAIAIRRYLAPQREVMARLPTETAPWLDDVSKAHLREVADRITRYVEDLDAARERAAVIQDELNTLIGDQLNRNTYVLTVIAAIFLPPSLLTGILGVNVGGIPGIDNPYGFPITLAGILLIAVVELWVLRRLKWI